MRGRITLPAVAAALFALLGPLLVTGGAPASGAGAYLHLTGSLHTHTGYSDGTPGKRPADAYSAVRAQGLDFLAVTEHSEALRVPMTLSESCLEGPDVLPACALADPDPVNAADKWDAQRRDAARLSVDGFVALRGFEWTSDTYGHINVYFSRNYATRLEGGEAALESFYTWLQTPPLAGGGADGIATFNHPGDKCLDDADPRCDWNDLDYVPALDDRIVGMEVFNRTRARYEDRFVHALDQGWHLGVVGAEDIHETNWGDPQYARTTFLASDRTPQAIEEAMRARRMYATLNNPVQIEFTGAGQPMGSRLRLDPDSVVPLEVSVSGGDVEKVELVTNGGEVAASAEGRTLSHVTDVPSAEEYYFVRVTSSDGRHSAYSSPIWVRNNLIRIVCPLPGGCEVSNVPPAPFEPQWVAGDLHVHTTWSHDSYGGPHDHNTEAVHCDDVTDPADCDYDAMTAGWSPGEQVAIAESRDLDYLASTDHNNTLSIFDPAWQSDKVTLLPAYEKSLKGHAQMLGAVSCYTTSGRSQFTDECPRGPEVETREGVRALADALRADGGVFQINHPSDGGWIGTFGDGSHADPVVPDSVEVWNIGPWHYQEPFPSGNDNDFSLRFWETYLDAGYKVAATGGSDNHWRSTTAAQGVGQPTTWVWVTSPGPQGVLEGIRAGRTTLSHQPPAFKGPRLEVTVDTDGDGEYESMIGDTVGAGDQMRIHTKNLPPGAFYRIVTSEGPLPIVSPAPETYDTVVPAGTWFYVELRLPDAREPRTATCEPVFGDHTTYCRNRLFVAALSSALYVEPAE